jgi:8-oxo-dGTP pyrophosphatase MutT (NUDIX family)
MVPIVSVKDLSREFVNGVSGKFNGFIPANTPVYGVSFVPIHLYARGENALIGKHCVVLGKERGGPYMDQFNFFGGKVDDKASVSKFVSGKDVARVLFEEVYEELHIALSPKDFDKALLKCLSLPFGNGISLVFVVHVKGLSRGNWDKENSARMASNVDWKYVEMSAIEHYPIDTLSMVKGVSKFVKVVTPMLKDCIRLLDNNRGVHVSKFASVCVNGKNAFVV